MRSIQLLILNVEVGLGMKQWVIMTFVTSGDTEYLTLCSFSEIERKKLNPDNVVCAQMFGMCAKTELLHKGSVALELYLPSVVLNRVALR